MELNDYLKVFRRHWLAVALFAVAGIAVAAAISIQQPKVYAANASGFVSTGSSQGAAEASIGDSLAKSRATSYVDLAKSRAVARSVANTLDIKAAPSALIGHISVAQPVDTVLIKITARDSTASGAQDLADAWVSALSDQVASIENPKGRNDSLRLVPIESAELPSSPISPNVRRNLGLGLLVGLLLGAAYALTRSQLDRRITSSEAVEREFGVTVAASIPRTASLERDSGGLTGHIMAGQVTSVSMSLAREAFLKLRTNLQFMDVDKPPRVLVVTSPLPGDGKSTVAANLAAALSVTGRAVVLVDGDLRRPIVAESFGVVDGLGLTDLIIGRAFVEDVLQGVPDLPNLWVIGAGRIPPNPSELLGSNAMAMVLDQLAKQFVVVIDAPPLLPVTDAAVLTTRADGALIVISSGRTLDTQLGDALGLLLQVKAHALGVVFNKVTKGNSDSGFYGTYYGDYRPLRRVKRHSNRTKRVVRAAEKESARKG